MINVQLLFYYDLNSFFASIDLFSRALLSLTFEYDNKESHKKSPETKDSGSKIDKILYAALLSRNVSKHKEESKSL